MYTDRYRIVQVKDDAWMVERLRKKPRFGFWPWEKTTWIDEWERSARDSFHEGVAEPFCRCFPTIEAAQKWIDDYRKYPLVVKDPA